MITTQLLILVIISSCAIVTLSNPYDVNVQSPGPAQFPFRILNQDKVTYTLNSTPKIILSTNKDKIHVATLEMLGVREIRSVDDLIDANNKLPLLKNRNYTINVDNYRLNQDPNLWDVKYGESNDTLSLLYSAELNNGAELTFQVFVNNASEADVLIPRANDTCVPTKCRCDQMRNIKRNSLKLNIGVKNWTFEEEHPETPYRFLVFDFTLTSPFEVGYYVNQSNIVSPPVVCNVIEALLITVDGFQAPLAFFDSFLLDGRIDDGVSVVFDNIGSIRFVSNGWQTIFYLVFRVFNNEMLYDPDLSLLLNTNVESSNGGTTGTSTGGGGDGTATQGDGGRNLSGGAVAGIVIGVVVGVAVIVVLLVLAGVGLTVLWEKRLRRKSAVRV